MRTIDNLPLDVIIDAGKLLLRGGGVLLTLAPADTIRLSEVFLDAGLVASGEAILGARG